MFLREIPEVTVRSDPLTKEDLNITICTEIVFVKVIVYPVWGKR